jgi:diguanylate cyclase (GGDEF)-like protein
VSASAGRRPPPVFVPVLTLIDRLRTAPRFLAVIAVVLLPGIVAGLSSIRLLEATAHQHDAARSGVADLAVPLTALVDLAQGRHGDGSDRTAVEAADDAAPRDVDTRLETARELQATIESIAREAGLLRHPDPGVQPLAEGLAEDLPDVLVTLVELSSAVPESRDVSRARESQIESLAAAADHLSGQVIEALNAVDDLGIGDGVTTLGVFATDAHDLARVLRGTTRAEGARPAPYPVVGATETARLAVDSGVQALDVRLSGLSREVTTSARVAAASLGLSLLVALWIANAMLWRTRTDVAQLVTAVRAIADGRRDATPVPTRNDEFGDVGRAIAATRTRLARAEAERADLLLAAQARQRLLERLVLVQRAIAARLPLHQVLDLVTRSAAAVLDDVVVGLVLVDSAQAEGPVLVSRFGALDGRCDETLLAGGQAVVTVGGQATMIVPDPAPGISSPGANARVIGAPVQLAGETTGGLVAILPATEDDLATDRRGDLLVAFAQQVTLALGDARNAEEVVAAHHDTLTGLPTRALFLDRLTRAIADRADGVPLALLFIDLDRFKSVNDTLGHQAGDELLTAAAGRLRRCLRSGDSPARLGGDEFAVLLPGATLRTASAVGQRIIDALREPFTVAGTNVVIDSSVGVALPTDPAPGSGTGEVAGTGADPAEQAATLLSSADVAMYRAKKRGGGHLVVFEPRMREEALEHLRVVTDVRQAMSADQFRIEYQPIVRLESGVVAGLEALLRWDHPQRGSVPPAEFVPVAEEIGLINELGRWVLRQSLAELARWQRDLPDLQLNVNVSGRQLADPGFPSEVAEEVQAAGVRPGALTLELTESVLMHDLQDVPVQLSRLKMLGVRLAIDDFGTGYSSLTYLRRLPVDDVKIDREFVAGVGRDPKDLAVVKTVLDLSATLRLRAVAEGIEHPGQVEVLRRLGCVLGQGWLLGRPVRPEQVDELLLAPSTGLGPRVTSDA